MAHERASLWAFARGELAREDKERVAAHLALCGDCAQALEETKTAQAFLEPGAVPALSAQRWRQIDDAVLAAAHAELTRPRWLQSLRSVFQIPAGAWVGAAVAAGAAALVVFWPTPTRPVAAPEHVAAAPLAIPNSPAVAVPPHQVLVSAAKHARSGQVPLSSRSAVAEGASVSTEKQGELWLTLPDGSRAGLLASTQMHLTQASAKTVELRVERGTLLVAATHRSERPFAVRAGELEVRVVGTRFLVERDDDGVGVAVQEGVVEAELGGKTQRVTAGQSVRFRNGSSSSRSLSEPQRVALARLEPPAFPRTLPQAPPSPISSDTPAIPDAATPELATAVPAEQTPTEAAPVVAPPLLTAPVTSDAGPRPAVKRDAPWPPLKLPLHMDTRITPLNEAPAEYQVRQMMDLADQDECPLAINRADQWLRAAQGGQSPVLRHKVLVTKARCLRKLGRDDEARAVDSQR